MLSNSIHLITECDSDLKHVCQSEACQPIARGWHQEFWWKLLDMTQKEPKLVLIHINH